MPEGIRTPEVYLLVGQKWEKPSDIQLSQAQQALGRVNFRSSIHYRQGNVVVTTYLRGDHVWLLKGFFKAIGLTLANQCVIAQ